MRSSLASNFREKSDVAVAASWVAQKSISLVQRARESARRCLLQARVEQRAVSRESTCGDEGGHFAFRPE